MKTAEQIYNIKMGIRVMQRVKANEKIYSRQLLDMANFQSSIPGVAVCTTEEELLHRCGTTACFAGFCGLSDEFYAMGLRVGEHFGAPYLTDPKTGDYILNDDGQMLKSKEIFARLFGISIDDAAKLCHLTGDSRLPTPQNVNDVIWLLQNFIPEEITSEKSAEVITREVLEKAACVI